MSNDKTLAYAVEEALGWRDGKRDEQLDNLLLMAMDILNSAPTLATVKHGGCVQVGGWLPALPDTDWNARSDGSEPLYSAEQMRDYARAALAARQPAGRSFQAGVAEWMGHCFLPSLYSNMTERGDRLLEEVLELLQAHGYDKARVPTLVDYVFGRPVGEPAQEVGGVMVTLAGYCWVAGLDMHAAGDAELARINQPEVMDKIRRKQEAKNALHFDTPLPGHAAPPAQAVDLPYSLDADPAGIRARVADVITGTLMVGAQGHTPPPAGHWAEPFWQAARADATAQAMDLGQFRSLARSWIVEAGGTAADTKHACADELLALIDGKAVGK